jgi:predicted ATPase
MTQDARPSVLPRPAAPYWSLVIRALREARGITQGGWATWLGYSRATVARWEQGVSVPDAGAESAIINYCLERGLLRTFDQGLLRNVAVTAEWLSELLAVARLGQRAEQLNGSGVEEQRSPEADSAPTAAPMALPGNLPTPLTTFVGREAEMEEILHLLRVSRLLTLTGTGGSGKTRMAVEIGRRMRQDVTDGAWLVELAGVQDGGLVPRTIASILGVAETSSQLSTDSIIDLLRTRALLLIIDNCEHLVDACAVLVERLVQACPALTVLVTSREPLRIMGETVYSVPGLTLPARDGEQTAQSLLKSDAVRLYLARAASVRPSFTLTDANAAAVSQICRRLDGLPLALELSASWVNLLAEYDIASRLDDRFRLLARGSRTAPPRHQALRATFDWSYELLTPIEQTMLARLSVFVGGWQPDAAEYVCAGGSIRGADVLDLLARLVDKSLVHVETQQHGLRHRLLETVREYAADRLRTAGQEAEILRRHRDWFLVLARQPVPQVDTPLRAQRLLRLDLEHDNLRAALGWSSQDSFSDAFVGLAAALGPFWEARGHAAEGLGWTERALQEAGALPDDLRARAAASAGKLAFLLGEYDLATRRLEEGRALYERTADRQGVADTAIMLGEISQFQGDYDRAAVCFSTSLTLSKELDDPYGTARALRELAVVASYRGEFDQAVTLCEESLAFRRRIGDRGGIVGALATIARVELLRRDYPRAVALFEEALALCREIGPTQLYANVLVDAGSAYTGLGELVQALACQRESLTFSRGTGARFGVSTCLVAIAVTLYRMGELQRATRLVGAAERLRDELNAPMPPAYRPGHDGLVRRLREKLGEERFVAAWLVGRSLPFDDAIAEALDE